MPLRSTASRLSMPRLGGMGTWGLTTGDFERRLAAQASATVAVPRVEGVTRRGSDYLRVRLAMTVTAADPGEALTVAWGAFRKAAGSDLAGCDTAGASAEVVPGSA
jgi:hypothetical protein